MRLTSVRMTKSAYDPAKRSAGVQESRQTYAEPEYQIVLEGAVVTVTHIQTGERAVYPFERCDHGTLEPAKQPNQQPAKQQGGRK